MGSAVPTTLQPRCPRVPVQASAPLSRASAWPIPMGPPEPAGPRPGVGAGEWVLWSAPAGSRGRHLRPAPPPAPRRPVARGDAWRARPRSRQHGPRRPLRPAAPGPHRPPRRARLVARAPGTVLSSARRGGSLSARVPPPGAWRGGRTRPGPVPFRKGWAGGWGVGGVRLPLGWGGGSARSPP